MITYRLLTFLTVTATAGALGAQTHDCIPYDPTPAGGVLSGEWSAANATQDWVISIPGDPGGGYATVTLSAPFPVVPSLIVDSAPVGGGVISSGSAAATDDEQRIIVVFEVAGGHSYYLRAGQSTNANPGGYPVQYSIVWSYTGKADCYEPNDAQPTWPDPVGAAREIPLDLVIEAYGIAGHVDYFIGAGDANTYDWYSFTLTQAQSITVATLRMPADQGTGLRLFDQSGVQRLSSPLGSPAGATGQMGPELLEAGTWYIEVEPTPRGESDVRPLAGQPIPDHFNSPYKLVVATSYSPTCGPAFIFCDDFESGDTSFWSFSTP